MPAHLLIKFVRRHRVFSASLAVALLMIMMGGCASPIPVTSNPQGANVTMGGAPLGVTPTQATPDRRAAVPFVFRLDGYFPETVVLDPTNTTVTEISAHLEPTTLKRAYDIASNPDGATVTLDGQTVGTTPAGTIPVVFVRDTKSSPWKNKTLVVSKTDYQTETITLTADTSSVPKFELALLKEDRVYTITAINVDGAELNADVTFNGKIVGKTPLKLPVTFQRPNKTAPWPKFPVSVEVPARYSPATTLVDFPGGTALAFKLNAITEITTDLVYPSVAMTPVGAALKTEHRHANAILSTRETAEIVSDIKMVTNFTRQDVVDAAASRSDSINSFCVTADGQNVIFALTEHDGSNFYSNLWIKRADSAASSQSRLTTSSAWDTLPYIANDSSNYLVFASNRGDRGKFDVYRATFVDNRISGGFSRLTNDNRFNYYPSYGDSNRQIFYLSTEPNFPKAESVISYMRNDGTLTTQLPTSAQEINNTFADKVFFVKTDQDTKTKQIYSITADGKLETALLNQDDFKKSNCFNPAVSLDGNRVLFVSDHGQDEQGRPNNDIYVVNSDGTGLQTLTRNGSDDIMPAWSPSEEGVIFFLSNRGGAYNIWRMKLSAGTK
jgi:Tol biopolymer transport system component